MALCRFQTVPRFDAPNATWGWVRDGHVYPISDAELLNVLHDRKRLGDLSGAVGNRGIPVSELDVRPGIDSESSLAAPVLPNQEIWAAGVTYESSKFARMAESAEGGDFYARVYVADRPELFFKATSNRVVGPNDEVRIRSDATWSVPEPELAAFISPSGRILGYTIGNDMSSRDIEGANPLYLPQAKVYMRSCALGPWIVPAEDIDPQNLGIKLTISRAGQTEFSGDTSTSRMKRTVAELAEWLFKENEFPN